MKKIIIMLIFISMFIFTACDNNNNKVITKDMVDEQNNKITKEEIKYIEDMFKGYDSVLDCSVIIEDKVVYVKVKFKESVTLKSAKMRCNSDLGERFKDYDIQYEIYGSDFHVKGFWIEEYNFVAWDDEYDYE